MAEKQDKGKKGKSDKKEEEAQPKQPWVTPRLKDRYFHDIAPDLVKRFSYGNSLAAPRLSKVVLNICVGEATQNPKILDAAVSDLTMVSGQKPIICRAKKSISGFKLRKGVAIACKVTLRGNRMYEFVDKLFNIALPRVRDFRGLDKKSFDSRANYTLGLKEQLVFPEIDYDKVDKIRGLDVTLVTTAKTKEEAAALLKGLGMPLKD